jgi:rhodanese-related sulfurtransferase
LCTPDINMNKITPAELKEWLNDGKAFILIDVREAWERELFNIGGVHIPFEEVLNRREEIPADKETVLYCEKGIRSAIVIQRLQTMGFHNLYNLAGGMSAWKKGTTD